MMHEHLGSVLKFMKAALSGIFGALLLLVIASAAGIVTGAFLGSAVLAIRLIGGL
jgi:hypothetical protein